MFFMPEESLLLQHLIYTVSYMAGVLAETELSPDEARAWRRDLRTAPKTAKPPADRWA